MTRVAHVLSMVAVIAVPAYGWFAAGWSGATTLVVYWFETLTGSLFIVARILLHRRWSPKRGHFRYESAGDKGRRVQNSSFVVGFLVTSLAFTAAHGVFLAVIIGLIGRNGHPDLAEIDWRSVQHGAMMVIILLVLDFFLDLPTLRRWTFWRIEQTAQRGYSRVVVVHLTLIFGLFAVAVTGVSDALFGLFVVLKSLASLSFALPQWEPARPPVWLSRIMDKAPNVHPGRRFEDFWARDRADELARRHRNEQAWESTR